MSKAGPGVSVGDEVMSKRYPGALTPEPIAVESWQEYREAWSRAEKLEILTEHPLHLDMELTSQCNLRCRMCWQSGALADGKQGMMDDELFKRVIDEGVALGLQAIKLQSRGESVLHPRIAQLAKYAKDAGVRDVQLTTNGTLFTKDGKLLDLLRSGLDKLIFSIDPAHDESAREIYGADRAPDVRKIVGEAFRLRAELGQTTPRIRIQTFAEAGQSKEDKAAEMRLEFPDADELMINHVWNSDYETDAVSGLQDRYELLPCSYLWTRVVVFWDGEVALCCRDYNNVHQLGNVVGSSVKDIWLGDRMNALRKAHLGGRRNGVKVCRTCDECVRPKDADQWTQMLHVVAEEAS